MAKSNIISLEKSKEGKKFVVEARFKNSRNEEILQKFRGKTEKEALSDAYREIKK